MQNTREWLQSTIKQLRIDSDKEEKALSSSLGEPEPAKNPSSILSGTADYYQEILDKLNEDGYEEGIDQ